MENNTKKSLIKKTWERCKSLGPSQAKTPSNHSFSSKRALFKSKSWSFYPFSDSNMDLNQLVIQPSKNPARVTPTGCFPVYVGSQRQKFVIKAECANHPLFRALLEEAESEYGYNCVGPIVLPCDVRVFIEVLIKMDGDDEVDDDDYDYDQRRCSFPRRRSFGQLLLSPARLVSFNRL